MEETKRQLQSTTIRACIVTIISGILSITNKELSIAPEQLQGLVDLILNGVTLISAAVAWYGRIKATKKIG